MEHIDIQTDKIISWLHGRGQLIGEWIAALERVQAQLRHSLDHEPYAIPTDIKRGMEERGLNYWSVQWGLDTLASNLLASRGHPSGDHGPLKNFLGRYSDPPLKALSALRTAYRKGNLHLAESAQMLTQAANYDIPALKKQVASCTKQSEDLVRKSADEARSARQLKSKVETEMKDQWGINHPAADMATQIKEKTEKELPTKIYAVIRACQEPKFGDAMSYYRAFVRYCMEDGEGPTGSYDEKELLPTIQAIRDGELMPDVGQTETDKEASIASETQTATGSNNSENSGIDWDISVESSGESGGATQEIDWSSLITSEGGGEAAAEAVTESKSGEDASGGINWGDEDAPAAAPSINWDIETSESGNAADSEPSPPSTSPSADSSSTLSLSSDSTRHLFLSELLELDAFLSERVLDLSHTDDLTAATFQATNVPHILTLQSQQTVQGYLDAVRACLQEIRSPRLTQLLMVRASKRYVERIVHGLKQQLSSVARLEKAAIDHESRRVELQRTASRSSHELSTLIEKSRDVKQHVEKEISQLFQNRPVSVVGEINTMLQ